MSTDSRIAPAGRSRLLAALLVLAALFAASCSTDERPVLTDAAGSEGLHAAGDDACDQGLGPHHSLVAEATTSGPISIFDSPGSTTPSTQLPNPKLVNDDPNVPVPQVFLVKEAPVADDCQWLHVHLPIRPNGSTGWVRRTDVSVTKHDYRIEVFIDRFNLRAYKGDEVILDAPIAVARENTPTPGGLYYTTELITPPDPDTVYGTHAYGLSGFSEVLESFNGGPGQLGIHGTNEPETIGQRVSAGCIRLHNDDIDKLAEVLPLGVPVKIIAG